MTDKSLCVADLLSGYLDGELTQQDRQRVRLKLEECSTCAQTYADLVRVRDQVRNADLVNQAPNWSEKMNDVNVKTSAGLGWLFLSAGVLLISAIAGYEFVFSGPISWAKIAVIAIYFGLACLFISVLRQRVIERKTDKYKDVEI